MPPLTTISITFGPSSGARAGLEIRVGALGMRPVNGDVWGSEPWIVSGVDAAGVGVGAGGAWPARRGAVEKRSARKALAADRTGR